MKAIPKGRQLTIVVIVIFAGLIPVVFFIDWMDKNVVNPRIWKDWTCDEMKKFAINFEDENFSEFQRSKFHEDLSLCLGR